MMMSKGHTDSNGYISHDAFGQISASRITGHRDLFQVDFPTGHFIRIKISKAQVKRDLSSNWISGQDTVAEVDLSEVQWAQLLCSMNTTGIACTLNRYRDPQTGELLMPTLPPQHTADADTFRNEVKVKAREAAQDIGGAVEEIKALLKAPSIKKGDLTNILKTLSMAHQQLASNLPYVVERALETISEAVDKGKAEINAHQSFITAQAGQMALAAKLHADEAARLSDTSGVATKG
jgi:hypothetical protein